VTSRCCVQRTVKIKTTYGNSLVGDSAFDRRKALCDVIHDQNRNNLTTIFISVFLALLLDYPLITPHGIYFTYVAFFYVLYEFRESGKSESTAVKFTRVNKEHRHLQRAQPHYERHLHINHDDTRTITTFRRNLQMLTTYFITF